MTLQMVSMSPKSNQLLSLSPLRQISRKSINWFKDILLENEAKIPQKLNTVCLKPVTMIYPCIDLMNIQQLVHKICRLAFDFDNGIKVIKRYSTPGVAQKVYLFKSGRNQANGLRNIYF